jgi:hypothetical protein
MGPVEKVEYTNDRHRERSAAIQSQSQFDLVRFTSFAMTIVWFYRFFQQARDRFGDAQSWIQKQRRDYLQG